MYYKCLYGLYDSFYWIYTCFGFPFYNKQTYYETTFSNRAHRPIFGEWAQNEMVADSDFHKKVLFSV